MNIINTSDEELERAKKVLDNSFTRSSITPILPVKLEDFIIIKE